MQSMSRGCTNGGEENFGSYLNLMTFFVCCGVNYQENDMS